MRWCAVLVAFFGTIPAAFGQSDVEKVDREWKLLQGEWSIVSVEDQDGKPTPEELKGMSVVFKGRSMFSRSKEGEAEAEATLDPSKQPKWIDTKDKKYGDAMQGIYVLDGYTLKLCLGRPGKRPEKFAVTGKDDRLIVLKKKK